MVWLRSLRRASTPASGDARAKVLGGADFVFRHRQVPVRRINGRRHKDTSHHRRDRRDWVSALRALGPGQDTCWSLPHAMPVNSRLSARNCPSSSAGQHTWLSVDMTEDSSIRAFGAELTTRGIILDGLVLMPPQLPRSNDPLPSQETWRAAFQSSFIGPLAPAQGSAFPQPDPENGRRPKVVVISAISSVQVLGHYALTNAVRAAWAAEAKTVAFALGGRGIHINMLSLGGILTPDYTRSIEQRAIDAGTTFEQRLAEETSNVPLGK